MAFVLAMEHIALDLIAELGVAVVFAAAAGLLIR